MNETQHAARHRASVPAMLVGSVLFDRYGAEDYLSDEALSAIGKATLIIETRLPGWVLDALGERETKDLIAQSFWHGWNGREAQVTDD